jgi:hypothetical protein
MGKNYRFLTYDFFGVSALACRHFTLGIFQAQGATSESTNMVTPGTTRSYSLFLFSELFPARYTGCTFVSCPLCRAKPRSPSISELLMPGNYKPTYTVRSSNYQHLSFLAYNKKVRPRRSRGSSRIEGALSPRGGL